MEAEMIFGGRLQHARNMTGLSQRQAAETFGITKVGYQNYEYGRREPSLGMLPRLATLFNVSLDYLLGRSDEPHPPTAEEWAMIHAFRKAKAEAAAKQEGKTDDEK